MSMRYSLASNQKMQCILCPGPPQNAYVHLTLVCEHPLPEINRAQMWDKIREFSKELEVFLRALTNTQAIRVLAGLALTQSEDTNQVLLQMAAQFICIFNR